MNKSDHISVETSRLSIIPLSHKQLINYIKLDGSLETELAVKNNHREVHDELRDAIEHTLVPGLQANPDKVLYSTLWTIIDRDENIMIGDLCFKGAPNANGEIEIGYGIYKEFQNRGYMSEAIDGILDWCFSQAEVTTILAETDKDNISSHKTLIKNGFVQLSEAYGMIWWIRQRQLT